MQLLLDLIATILLIAAIIMQRKSRRLYKELESAVVQDQPQSVTDDLINSYYLFSKAAVFMSLTSAICYITAIFVD